MKSAQNAASAALFRPRGQAGQAGGAESDQGLESGVGLAACSALFEARLKLDAKLLDERMPTRGHI